MLGPDIDIFRQKTDSLLFPKELMKKKTELMRVKEMYPKRNAEQMNWLSHGNQNKLYLNKAK